MSAIDRITYDLMRECRRKVEEVCQMALEHYGCKPHELEIAVYPDGSYRILGPRPTFATLDRNGDRVT